MNIFKISFIVLGVLFLAGESFSKGEKAPKKKLKTVTVSLAKKKKIFDTFVYPAKVIPKVNAWVIAESNGIIHQIVKKLGRPVKKGEVIIRIKHTDPVYKYKAVRLKAPVSGIVSKVSINEGSLVSSGQQILQITRPDLAKANIELSTKDLQYIYTGQKGKLFLKGIEKPFAVKIVGISPFVDPSTGTATAELELISKNKKRRMPLGSIGSVEFISNQHYGIVLSRDAVKFQGHKTFVRILQKGKKVKKQSVTLGPNRRGQVEILKGLKRGDVIIDRASGHLAEGATVKVGNPKAIKGVKL